MLCLIFFLSPHFTVYKASSPWAEHQSEQLGASTLVARGSLRAQVKGLRGQMRKRGKKPEHVWNTQAARDLLKSFGTKSGPWNMVGEERNSCAFYYDVSKTDDRIHFVRSPKTATTPIWAALKQTDTICFIFETEYILVASKRLEYNIYKTRPCLANL